MSATPILFLGDAPSLHGGLSRIGRDLATLTSTLPEFRVGFLGRGGIAKRKFPFMQYNFPEAAQWGETYLQEVWRDFARDEKGIIFTIWDPSRLLWFSQPQEAMGPLYEFLQAGKFQRWGYFAVDATGPGERLTLSSTATIAGFDRALAYTEFGATVIRRSLMAFGSSLSTDWLPHGIELSIWKPRGPEAGRIALHCESDDIVIGMNATNQPRKDWGCAFAAVAELRKHHKNLRFWCHTDIPRRHWDFNALTADYGLGDCVMVTYAGSLTDTELSYYYSACNLTILPSSEGFGYPIVESLACGVPCLHSSYGGGAELIPDIMPIVNPCEWRLETAYNCVRPVFDPKDWASTIETMLTLPVSSADCVEAVRHLGWDQLWPARWKKWMLEGLK